jgi:hypothetical protein
MITFHDPGTGFYTISRNGERVGRMTKMACGAWYFTHDPAANLFHFAAERFNDAKRVVRTHFA